MHTLVNATGEIFLEKDNSNQNRHTLTRCLNAKRFAMPDIQSVPWRANSSWLLCSDGYWADHLGQKIPWEKLEDDSSCLVISEQLTDIQKRSDCDNCFVYQK